MLLSLLFIIPFIGVFSISTCMSYGISLSNQGIKITGLVTSVLNLLCSLLIFILFDFNVDPFVQDYYEISTYDFYLGLDGLSIYFILLTTLIVPIALLSNWKSIKENIKTYVIITLLLESLIIAVFLVLDILLFYVLLSIISVLLLYTFAFSFSFVNPTQLIRPSSSMPNSKLGVKATYNPIKIFYNAIYNYKFSVFFGHILVIICLLLIKKLVTGNYFIVSMSNEEGIIIFILGTIIRTFIRHCITNMAEGSPYDYKLGDLIFWCHNKLFKGTQTERRVLSNTRAIPNPGAVASGVAAGSVVASRRGSADSNDSNNPNGNGFGRGNVLGNVSATTTGTRTGSPNGTASPNGTGTGNGNGIGNGSDSGNRTIVVVEGSQFVTPGQTTLAVTRIATAEELRSMEGVYPSIISMDQANWVRDNFRTFDQEIRSGISRYHYHANNNRLRLASLRNWLDANPNSSRMRNEMIAEFNETLSTYNNNRIILDEIYTIALEGSGLETANVVDSGGESPANTESRADDTNLD